MDGVADETAIADVPGHLDGTLVAGQVDRDVHRRRIGEVGLDRGLEREPLTVAPEPVGRRLAQRRPGRVHAENRLPELLRLGRPGDEAVHAVLDELHGRVVGRVDYDRRRADRRRLDDDLPVPLAARRKDEAERAPHGVLDELARDEARSLNSSVEPALVDQPQQRVALRPVAEDRRAQLGDALTGERNGRHERGRLLLRDEPSGEDDRQLGGHGLGGLLSRRQEPLEQGDLAAVADLLEPTRVTP